MEIIKSNYAKINDDKRIITLLNESPETNGLEITIEDAVIVIDEGILTITGDAWDWGFAHQILFVEDMKFKPIKSHTKMGYKTILDLIKGIKNPYVKMGWFLYQKTIPYKSQMSQWLILYDNF